MFELNSASQTDEHVDGIPVVRVTDSAEDMEHLLRALMDASQLATTPINDETSAMISAVLRLSTKYIIPNLRLAVSTALLARVTVQDFLDMDREMDENVDLSDTTSFNYEAFLPAHETLESDIQLANACEESQLLFPLAIFVYRSAVANLNVILNGPLSRMNLRRVLVLRISIPGDVYSSLCRYDGYQDGCADGHECGKAIRRCLDFWASNMTSYTLHSFAPWDAYSMCGDICVRCREAVDENWEIEKKYAVSRLPRILEIGETWTELKRKDDAFQANLRVGQAADNPSSSTSL